MFTKNNTMKEDQNIEYKSSWRDEYLKWICGFANASGGKIFIGIDDDENIVGVADAKKLLEDIPNKVRDVLGIVADVNLHTYNSLDYIEIIVEPFPYPVNYKGQYHYRSGGTKQELKGVALNKFLTEREGKKWDGVTLPKIRIEDLSISAFSRFKEKAAESKRVDESVLEDSNLHLLEDLKLIDDNFLKRAAILLFHPNPELFVSGSYIKIGYFINDDDLAFQDEVHGNIFVQIDKSFELIKTKYSTYTISYEGVSRKEKSLFPEKAIREALLNAIVHKDYSDETPIQISVYKDHIIFWNPGNLPEKWTLDSLYKKHPSKPFNPDIANTLFRSGDIEAWGRGILKMSKESILQGSFPPIFNSDYSGIMVTIYSSARDLLIKEGVAENLIKAIEYTFQNGTVTNSNIQQLLKVSKPTATRILQHLEKWLEKSGDTGKGTSYSIKGLTKGS